MRYKNGKIMTKICVAALSLLLAGCAGKGRLPGENGSEEIKPEETEISFLKEEVPEEGAAWMETWKDNKVDETYAAINRPIRKAADEGGESLGRIFVGEGGCTYFENHSHKNRNQSWSGASGVSSRGEEFSHVIEVDPNRKGLQIQVLGPRSCETGYVACYTAYNENWEVIGQWLYELDENCRLERSVKAGLKSNRPVTEIMGDGDGNYHVTYDCVNGKHGYAVISPEGGQLFSAEVESMKMTRLCALKDGKVSLATVDYNPDFDARRTNERRFYKADLKQGVLLELAASRDDAIQARLSGFTNGTLAAMPVSDEEITWCDRTGVYSCKAEGGNAIKLYEWSTHGMTAPEIDDLTVTKDGNVGILFREGEENRYLLLKTTEQKEELKQITFAVSPYNKAEYVKAAALFKKRYPAYLINLADDYEETNLLTQLGAGKGPVLVDTELTGFENLKNLWQPLDGFLEQAGLEGEVLPETMEFGRIDGVTYGIVKDFRIETLLVKDSGPTDWDYKGFLDELENFNGAPVTYFAIDHPLDWREKYFSLMSVREDDNYYFNAKTGETIFGTQEFERVLKLSSKAMKCPPAEDGKALQRGDALCEEADLLILAQVIRLRHRLEANGERAIGYPTAEGARHLLASDYPIAMRSTATEEEKEIAYTFLKCVLSREAAMDNPNLSVRKDVLEYQFSEYDRNAAVLRESGKYGEDFAPELDLEADEKFLKGLLQSSKVKRALPSEIGKVFDEEFGEYLDGRIDGKTLDDHLKNRVWLYLEEAK